MTGDCSSDEELTEVRRMAASDGGVDFIKCIDICLPEISKIINIKSNNEVETRKIQTHIKNDDNII